MRLEVEFCFTFDANTTKGTITSAVLVVSGKNGENEEKITLSTGSDSDQNITVLAHKLSGWRDYTVTPTALKASSDSTLYAKMILTVTQGGKQYPPDTSNVIDMSDNFRLTIRVNDGNTSEDNSLTYKAYTAEGTQLVDHSNGGVTFKAPVLGQGTTLCAYVNASDAVVTINGVTVTDPPEQYGTTDFYLYKVTGQTWTGTYYGDQTVTVTAVDAAGIYKKAEKTFKVPVYHINPGNSTYAITGKGVVPNNWYLLQYCSYLGNNGYVYFDGTNLTYNSNYDSFEYVMGFSAPGNPVYIYFAKASISYPAYSTSGEIVFQSTGTQYWLKNGTSGLRIDIDDTFAQNWYGRTTSNPMHWGVPSLSSKLVVESGSSPYFLLYPITFSMN